MAKTEHGNFYLKDWWFREHGKLFFMLIGADIIEHMVDYWLVLELYIQYRINFLQNGDCGANLVQILLLDTSGQLFYVLLIKWAITVTKRCSRSKILSSLPNLGSRSLHLQYLGKVKCDSSKCFLLSILVFSFHFSPAHVWLLVRRERKKSSTYMPLNGIDFTPNKKHVKSVWVVQYENLSECERVDPTRKL